MPKKVPLDQVIHETASNFLSQIGFSSQITVQLEQDEENNSRCILLGAKDPALVIGYHGETLSALQLLLNLHLHSKTGSWLNVSLNVNDYRQRREAALRSLVDSAVSSVLASGLPRTLPPMPAVERRVVHLYLANHSQVSTSSEGVGRNRSVVISLKK